MAQPIAMLSGSRCIATKRHPIISYSRNRTPGARLLPGVDKNTQVERFFVFATCLVLAFFFAASLLAGSAAFVENFPVPFFLGFDCRVLTT
jgi:hypothetical protein